MDAPDPPSPDPAGVVPAAAGDPDPAAALRDSLRAALQARGTDAPEDVLRAVVRVVTAGPVEADDPVADGATALFAAADLPEARACRAWLGLAAGDRDPAAAGAFDALAGEPLWPPVRALVWRALVWFGRRHRLAELLPPAGPLDLFQADAWLEAAHPEPPPADRAGSVSGAGPVPEAVGRSWAALLAAEAALARDGPSAAVAAALAAAAGPHAGAAGRWVAGRALAARVRAGIAAGRADPAALDADECSALPAWEREYLHGLALWAGGDDGTAALAAAHRANPHQTCVRLAIAAATAPRSAADALDLLDHPAPTREVLVARTALLARVGKFAEADDTLARLDRPPAPGREPARFSWPRGRAAYRRQEFLLRAALAERRGAWAAAADAWRASGVPDRSPGLGRARATFAAARELAAIPPEQSFRRDVARRRLERESHGAAAVLVKDALFFRAARPDADPGRAAENLHTLLRQSAWVAAERRAGGGRLVAAGDRLLRLGRFADAARAYELAGDGPAIRVRLAVARAAAGGGGDADPEVGPWPALVAAAAALARGDTAAADAHLASAEGRGADPAVVGSLRAVRTGDPAAAHLPTAVGAVLRLMAAPDVRPEDVAAFVRAVGDGWPGVCPVDPEWAARLLLTGWCGEGKRAAARDLADALVARGLSWAGEPAALVRVGGAIADALAGRLEDAARALDPAGEGVAPSPPASRGRGSGYGGAAT